MEKVWEKLVEQPIVACVLIICMTILGCVLVFGAVSCTNYDYEYKLKMYAPR